MTTAGRWVAIVNPAAGRGRARRLLPAIAERLHAIGADVAVSGSPDDLPELARDAFAGGAGVLACGGDGTVGLLAGVAAEQEGVLAIMPLGAGNDFACHLGLNPRRPFGAVDLLRSGRVAHIDLARATADGNTRWFANAAAAGFDAEANRWANGVTALSGTPLYLAAVARTLAVYRPRHFRLTVDDRGPEEHKAWLLAIANGVRYGGGMRIAPAARLDDGLLDVTIVGSISRREFVRSFPMVLRGTHVEHPAVSTRRGHHIVVEPLDAGTTDESWADGERVGRLPVTVDVAPGALRLVVPEGAPVERFG